MSEDLVAWSPGHYPPDSPGFHGVCRFSPGCMMNAPRPGCPDNPAVISERVGSAMAGDRYVALCLPRAVQRHGPAAVEALGV